MDDDSRFQRLIEMLTKLGNYVTDIVGIVAIAYIATETNEAIIQAAGGMIMAIALGTRYMKMKNGGSPS